LQGSRSKYLVCLVNTTNKTLLEIQEFSCFYLACINGVGNPCPQSSPIGPWILITLEPCDANDAQFNHDNDVVVIGGDKDTLVIDL
jgi:hypothetical protein